MASPPGGQAPRVRWSEAGAGERYDLERWQDARRRARDPATVQRLLAGRVRRAGAAVLDAPAGTGRLRTAIESHGRWIGVDASREMLRRSEGARVQGDVEHLPFGDRSFEAVVCCRLLHHMETHEALVRVLRELVRVSDRWILASFWDAASLEALRHRLPFVRRPRRRVAHPRVRIESALEEAGAWVEGWHQGMRFLSRQSWVLARRLE